MSGLSENDCVPCRGGVPPLAKAEQERLLKELSGWAINAAGHLEKTYPHEGFLKGLEFVKRVGEMCEAQHHHGDLHLAWGGTRLEVWTHKINGLVEADFVWAAKADVLWYNET
ncbi:MAG: 4a-hydroxytetrahydrobiopterin dehydratase [Elusimicrobia bacterium]|nr:4a-hydroxytetrahydrobiopterin dehydratase [Elusimicrobiota bacterium]